MNEYPSGYTRRTKCGYGRATYHPEWDKSNPWIVYIDGDCKCHAPSLYYAGIILKQRYGAELISDADAKEFLAVHE